MKNSSVSSMLIQTTKTNIRSLESLEKFLSSAGTYLNSAPATNSIGAFGAAELEKVEAELASAKDHLNEALAQLSFIHALFENNPQALAAFDEWNVTHTKEIPKDD